MDTESIRRAIADRLTFTIGKDTLTATELGWLNSVSYAIRADRTLDEYHAQLLCLRYQAGVLPVTGVSNWPDTA